MMAIIDKVNIRSDLKKIIKERNKEEKYKLLEAFIAGFPETNEIELGTKLLLQGIQRCIQEGFIEPYEIKGLLEVSTKTFFLLD